MNYILSKTTNGTTYYAGIGETNAIVKTKDIIAAIKEPFISFNILPPSLV